MVAKRLKKRVLGILCLIVCLYIGNMPVSASLDDESILAKYQAYEAEFWGIQSVNEIEEQGFFIIQEQVFSVLLESFGEQEVTFIPAMDRKYHRLTVFIADLKGEILYRCNQLATNQLQPSQAPLCCIL